MISKMSFRPYIQGFYVSFQHMLPDSSEITYHNLRPNCPRRPYASRHPDCNAWVAQKKQTESLTPDFSCPQTTLVFPLFRPIPMCLKGIGPTIMA